MNIPRLAFALLLTLTFLLAPQLVRAQVSALTTTEGGGRIAIGTATGDISFWPRGGKSPTWRLSTDGTKVIKLIGFPDGNLLAVDNMGVLRLIAKGGQLLRRVVPVTGGIRSGVPFKDFNHDKLLSSENRREIIATAATNRTGTRLWMAGDMYETIYQVDVTPFRKLNKEAFFLSKMAYVTFPDPDPRALALRIVSGSLDIDVVTYFLHDAYTNDWVSALAVCDDLLFVGSVKGRIVAFDVSGKVPRESSPLYGRRVNDPAVSFPKIEDVACSNSGHAASIGFSEYENGLIQLWKSDTGEAISVISQDGPAHPGVGRSVVFHNSGKFLLSTGDMDIRLWSVGEEGLTLIAKAYRGNTNSEPIAAASPDGSFIVAFGDSVYSLDPYNLTMALVAGTPSTSPKLVH